MSVLNLLRLVAHFDGQKSKVRSFRHFTSAFRVNEHFLSLLVGSFPFRERPLTLRSLVEGVM
jgi:hypothetical protein